MVFVALPGLRASQRDAERREDMTMFLESVKKYQTNNRGALPGSLQSGTLDSGGVIPVKVSDSGEPTSWAGFYQKYLGSNFADPDGTNYELLVMACNAQPDSECTDGTSRNKQLGDLYESTFPNNYTIYVVEQATCAGDRAVGTANPRKLSALYRLERAGVYCANI